MKKRVIIIGDVHGCLKELTALLKKTKFDAQKDRLIFLGDLINKGPDSVGVVRFVREGGFECIIGNHELGFLKSLDDPRYFNSGFKEFYNDLGSEREEVIKWLKGLPLYIEDDNFICIHGGLKPGVSLDKQRVDIATRIRTWTASSETINIEGATPWYDHYDGDKLVVYGHWAAQGLMIRDNTIGLDTGCVWGGKLTALILPEREIIQIEALKQYVEP